VGALALALGGSLLGGCLPDDSPPAGPDRPDSCDDGTCDGDENCGNCPEDCSCCVGIDVRGLDQEQQELAEPERGTGEPDGSAIKLDERSDLFVALGRDFLDDPDQHDFTIHGTVASSGSVVTGERCPEEFGDEQGFEIMASADAASWFLVGVWTAEVNTFDLGCAALQRALFIRIKAQTGAAGTFDAITAEERSCLRDGEAP